MNEDRPMSRRAFRRYLQRESKEVKKKHKLNDLLQKITTATCRDGRNASDSLESTDSNESTDGNDADNVESDPDVEDSADSFVQLQEVVENFQGATSDLGVHVPVQEENDDEIALRVEGSPSESSSDEDDVPVNNIVFENEEEKCDFVRQALREWSINGGTSSMRKIDSLLRYLRVVFPNLPKSYKTLLQTPTDLEFREFTDGSTMWYKGIQTTLNSMLLEDYLDKYGNISLDVNMDGLPLSKSSKIKFFPILGYLVNTVNQPFLIGVYFGEWDPIDVHSYLHDYVNELSDLFENGYRRNDKIYPFTIRHYILDAPARSLVKCCVNHGGYGACEKCTVEGEMVADRMVYLDLNAPKRTDESFRNQEDPLHHVGRTILERVHTKMVSQFRLDPFHLVWHGVFKRLLTVLNEWNGPWKFSRQNRADMSTLLIFLSEFCPSDFCRRPRAFEDWKLYKGTEERRLCLYDGLLVFRDQMQKNVYKNYLLLHAALYILSSPVFVKSMCGYADHLLRTFIEHSVALYGRQFVVYNVHCLCHLAEECSEYGPLDDFSAFKFENFLKSLKSSLKSGYKPLQQAANRDIERSKIVHVKLDSEDKTVSFSNTHIDPEEHLPGTHFKCVVVGDCKFQLGNKDSCFRSIDGDIYVLKNIVRRGTSVFLVGNKFLQKGDFYDYPLLSSEIGILKLARLDNNRHNIPLMSVDAKCFLMPDGDEFLCVPLLHTFPLF